MMTLEGAYLRDLISNLIELGRLAKVDMEGAQGEDRVYQSGRRMAYYEVISLMQTQAEAFNLDFTSLGLSAIDPDRELL